MIEARYIESGTFVAGEEDVFNANIEKGETVVVLTKEEMRNWIDYQADVKRLTREIDVAMNGEEGAAKQASLCDVLSQVKDFAKCVHETKRQLDQRFKQRSPGRWSGGGKKLWEEQLLWLANKALGKPTGKWPEKFKW